MVTAPPYLPSNPSLNLNISTLHSQQSHYLPHRMLRLRNHPLCLIPSSLRFYKKIQSAGGGPIANPSTSLFATRVPITHPLKPLLDASLDSILQAVSPSTIHSYLTARRCFKAFTSPITCHFPISRFFFSSLLLHLFPTSIPSRTSKPGPLKVT